MILILGCLKRLVAVVLLLVIAVLVWHFRDTIVTGWHRFRGEAPPAVATPADLARSGQLKLSSLAKGSAQGRVALSGGEVQALLHSRFSGMVPDYLDSARVELDGDRIKLLGRIPTDRLPNVQGMGEVMGLLPDTTDVAVTGQVIPLGGGRAALAVDQVTAARIPLPHKLVTELIDRVRRGGNAPSGALPFPLPRGANTAYVRSDSLVLLSAAPAGSGS